MTIVIIRTLIVYFALLIFMRLMGKRQLSELELPSNYKFHGKTLSQMQLPVESIIVSIFRDGNLIIPRGNTQLLSGDRIVVMCKSQTMHELCRLLELQ